MQQISEVMLVVQRIPDYFVLRLRTPHGNIIEVGKAPWSYVAMENGMHSLCAYTFELKTYQDKYGVVYEHTIYKLAYTPNAWPLQQGQTFTLTQDPELTVTE
jgi:hypothetical protein